MNIGRKEKSSQTSSYRDESLEEILQDLTQAIGRVIKSLPNAKISHSKGVGFDRNSSIFDFSESSMAGLELQLARSRPTLPDPRLVREIIRRRQARARFFDADLFADPAWDMLLDLSAAHAEHRRVSVTSLCIASGVPSTTALRWIREMTAIGLFERVRDSSDKRRVYISLSDSARDAMAGYFAAIAASEPAAAFAA